MSDAEVSEIAGLLADCTAVLGEDSGIQGLMFYLNRLYVAIPPDEGRNTAQGRQGGEIHPGDVAADGPAPLKSGWH